MRSEEDYPSLFYKTFNEDAKAYTIAMLSRQSLKERNRYMTRQYRWSVSMNRTVTVVDLPWFVGGSNPRSLPTWLFQKRDARGRFGQVCLEC